MPQNAGRRLLGRASRVDQRTPGQESGETDFDTCRRDAVRFPLLVVRRGRDDFMVFHDGHLGRDAIRRRRRRPIHQTILLWPFPHLFLAAAIRSLRWTR